MKIAYYSPTQHISLMAFELRKRGHDVLINECTKDCDFIYSGSFSTARMWLKDKEKYNLPVVEWCWDLPHWRTAWRLPPGKIKENQWRDDNIRENVERAKNAVLVLCGAKWVQDDLKTNHRIDAVQMYYHIDTESLDKVAQPPPKNTVVQISRLDAPNKRFEDTIKAMSQVSDYKLVIVGWDKIRIISRLGLDRFNIGCWGKKKEFKGIADSIGMKNLKILTNQPNTIRVKELKKAKLLVSPQSEDGWGMSVLEALYSGVPVVTTNLKNYRDMYGDFVKYCEPFNPQDLAEKIRWMLDNPAFGTEQVDKLKPFVSSLTVEKATDRWLDIIKNKFGCD